MKFFHDGNTLPTSCVPFCSLLCHQIRAVPASLKDANWICVTSSLICCTLQYTSICLIQLSSFSAFTSPSYRGNSNFTSSFNNGISFLFLCIFFFSLGLELELEEEGEEGGVDGGEGGI